MTSPAENPKSEYRNPKQIRNPNDQNRTTNERRFRIRVLPSSLFGISTFEFVSDFEIRISDFQSRGCARIRVVREIDGAVELVDGAERSGGVAGDDGFGRHVAGDHAAGAD